MSAAENGAASETPAQLAGREVAHDTIAEALLAAQTEMPAVEPDKENGGFKGSKYVSLGNLLSKVRPVLNKHGLALMQSPRFDEDGKFVLRTSILHKSGESLEFDSPLTPTKNDPQGQGSAITYMRRYSAASTLAIADQEDDDGEASSDSLADGAAIRLRAERVASIIDVFRELRLTGAEMNVLLDRAGAARLRVFTGPAIEAHVASLGEIEADKLEAELAGESISADPTGLPDETVDQLVKGFEIVGEELDGITPLDGLNLLLGAMGIDAFEPGDDAAIRAQFAALAPDQAEALHNEFTASLPADGEPITEAEVVDEIPADADEGVAADAR